MNFPENLASNQSLNASRGRGHGRSRARQHIIKGGTFSSSFFASSEHSHASLSQKKQWSCSAELLLPALSEAA